MQLSSSAQPAENWTPKRKDLVVMDQVQKKFQSFLDTYKTLKAKKGEVLIRPGDIFHQFIFVKSGFMRQYVISKLGQELTINLIQPSYPFAFVNLITETKNHYYFECYTPVEYYRIPKKELTDFLDQSPDVYHMLTKQAFSRMEDLFVNLEFFLTGDAYMKVASVFYIVVKRLGRERGDGTFEVDSMPTHRDISEALGLTRETVSLQILKLEKDGVIVRTGRKLTIPNMKKLEEVSAYVAD